MPVWNGLELIRDPYTGATEGETVVTGLLLLAIPAFAVFHSASKGRTITGSMIRMILSRSV